MGILIHVPIAFAAGLLSFFAPCGTFLLPGFFAYAFKERGRLLTATWVFLAGFAALFIPVGLGLRALAVTLALHRIGLSWFGGLFMIALGVMALLGRGVHIAVPSALSRPRRDPRAWWSVFLLGVTFGFTVAGCTAPLLAITLALAGGSGGFLSALAVLCAYVAGLGAPLLALAFASDRGKFLGSRVFHAETLALGFGRYKLMVAPANALAAAALFVLGIWYIMSQGMFFTGQYVRWHGAQDFNASAASWLSRRR
ncbi:MAG: hypothetical protein RLZZ324_127 [Candidatus Parcubacteria bacterium]|jgi:cytochrome c biogenesis protein CcdA